MKTNGSKSAVSTPALSLHQLSLYNTGRMPAEQVIAAFAARRSQFERIVSDIAAEQGESRAQHHLVPAHIALLIARFSGLAGEG